jgi:hypothetical protein
MSRTTAVWKAQPLNLEHMHMHATTPWGNSALQLALQQGREHVLNVCRGKQMRCIERRSSCTTQQDTHTQPKGIPTVPAALPAAPSPSQLSS